MGKLEYCRMENSSDFFRGFRKDVIVPVIVAFLTALVTKTCDKIVPGENKVIISDTLRVVEAHSSRYSDDSLLCVAISELNQTIRETANKNNNIKIVWPESGLASTSEGHHSLVEGASPVTTDKDKSLAKTSDQSNKVVDKKGFYKKGYTISNGGAFYVLQKAPKVSDPYLVFEIDLLQPVDLISHIFVTICSVGEKGELNQFFSQAYEIREGINIIRIANNLRKGKNRIDIGIFMKSDEGRDYPTFYRNVITLEK